MPSPTSSPSSSLSNKEKCVSEFYLDNCCSLRNKLRHVFGPQLVVLLDDFAYHLQLLRQLRVIVHKYISYSRGIEGKLAMSAHIHNKWIGGFGSPSQ